MKSTWVESLIPNEMYLVSSETGGKAVCMLCMQLEMSAEAQSELVRFNRYGLFSSLISETVNVLQELQFIGCSTYEKHSLLLLFCL